MRIGAYSQTGGPALQRRPGHRHRAVAVSIGLDGDHQLGAASGAGLERRCVVSNGVQVNLRPGDGVV